jgi:hypothetical protein
MYMAKRFLKNKHLLRNLFILAGLLIVGFFVWRAFFSRTRILEGNNDPDIQDPVEEEDPLETALVSCNKTNPTNIFPCLSTKLNIEEGDISDLFENCAENNSEEEAATDCAFNGLKKMVRKEINNPVEEALVNCYTTNQDNPDNVFPCLSTELNIKKRKITTLFNNCAKNNSKNMEKAIDCAFTGLDELYANK